MALDPNTTYIYLNSANEVVLKIEWENPAGNILYIRQNGSAAPAGNYGLADDVTSFTLYADGSISRYRYAASDGSFQALNFAQSTPATAQVFGPDNSYTHGALSYAEFLVVNDDGFKFQESKTFLNGNVVGWNFQKLSTPTNTSDFVVQGSVSGGTATLTANGIGNLGTITQSATGFLNRVNQLDLSTLVRNDGVSLVGNDGGTLVGNDGASLIGNDSAGLTQATASLIGNDSAGLVSDRGGALIDFAGGARSIVDSSYSISNGRLISDNGAILIGNDGSTFAANAMSMMRGYRVLTTESFKPFVGTGGADTLQGGDGNDIIRGGFGADAILGGDGDDTLYGADTNFIRNGSFENVFQPVFDSGGYSEYLTRQLDGWTVSGAGVELYRTGSSAGSPTDGRYGIDLEGRAPGANIAISQTVKDVADGQLYWLAFDVRKANASATARLEVTWGGTKQAFPGGAQFVDATTGNVTYYLPVYGGAGTGAAKNTLTFREIGGGDYFGTLLDNVRLYKDGGSPSANDPLLDGGDTFAAGAGSDAVFGHGGDDVGAFNGLTDPADGRSEADHFNGGSGTDTLIMDWNDSTTGITYRDLYEGGVANVSGRIGLAESYVRSVASGSSRTQTLFFNEVEKFNLVGGSGNDTLKGGALNDTLVGGAGTDALTGNEGADTITGGSGRDTLSGGSGDDLFLMSAGDEASGEAVDGGIGTDEIRTSSSTLDLRGMSISGIETIRTTNGTGTAFTIDNAGLVDLLRGGSGTNDSVTASGLTLTSAQRNTLLANGFESVTDQTGTYRPNGAPTISGLTNSSLGDKSTANPFGSVTVADPNGDGLVATVTIAQPGNGVFTAASLASAGFTATGVAGQYVSGRVAPATLTNALRALVFDPTENQVAVGSVVNTGVSLAVGDATGATASGSLSVGVTSVNDAPTITAYGGGAVTALSVAENTTAVGQLVATDPDPGSALTYSLVESGESFFFTVNPTTGALSFRSAPDFEAPGTINGQYAVTVRVSDANGGQDDMAFQVTVTDQNTFTGTGGDDVVYGENGPDQLEGLGGNDVLIGYGALGGVNALNGGAGIDTASYAWTGATVVASLATGRGSVGGVDTDRFTSIENLRGGAASDTLSGNAGDNILDGGVAGADTMSGGAGNDTYFVDNSGDVAVEKAGEGIDLLYSTVSFTLGAEIENLVLTGTANSAGGGNALGNIIFGNSGNNVLDGAGGADTLIGGVGNDTYVVESIFDSVVENAGEGLDTVNSFVSYTLGANVENLTLFGTADLVGGGNGGNNQIVGNGGRNLLDGGAGADTMFGGGGDDTYVIENGGDIAAEGTNAGTDTVNAFLSHSLGANVENLTLFGTGNLVAGGNGLGNQLVGNSGNNILDGAAGADTMFGGTGNDTYVVDDAGDVAAEGANAGTDTVNSFVSFSLGAEIENLTLFGGGNLVGGGNGLGNVLIGNAGSNTLDGSLGADTMIGGFGDDTFVVDDVGDIVADGVGEGVDTVNSYVGFSLGANVENLTLIGGAGINGSGNGAANRIIGNGAANTLDGLGGADTLFGLGGDDAFVFRRGQSNGDTIGDFAGNGAAAGDSLQFIGYGTAAQGATLTQVDATRWSINSADGLVRDVITLSNGATVNPADYVFV